MPSDHQEALTHEALRDLKNDAERDAARAEIQSFDTGEHLRQDVQSIEDEVKE